MARRRQTLFDDLITLAGKLPWWLAVVLAVAAHVGLRAVATSEVAVAAQPGGLDGFVGRNPVRALAWAGQYAVPLVFLLAAAMSAWGRHARRGRQAREAAGTDAAALNAIPWQQFTARVGEAFRRRGYSVREAGGGGADGDVDLVMKKDGETYLVQCRHWRAPRVGVAIVRELHGVMAAQGASGGFVVTSGVFTDEAVAFARGRHIELMAGPALHALIAGVKAPVKYFRDPLSVLTMGAPYCPECQFRMVRRKLKRGEHAGREFWRCARYPECRGTRPL